MNQKGVAYSRLGMRSAMPVMLAMMLLWEIITPLGMPVEPLVYMTTAMSDGAGCLCVAATERDGRRKTKGVDESQSSTSAGSAAGLVDNSHNTESPRALFEDERVVPIETSSES